MNGRTEDQALEIALSHARKGREVFPLKGKQPLVKWTTAATSDPLEVKKLWANHRDADGVAWRIPAGQVVLDVDDPQAFAALVPDLPDAPGQTSTRGFHRLYLDPGVTQGRVAGVADLKVGGKGYVKLYSVDAFEGDPTSELPTTVVELRASSRPKVQADDSEPMGSRDELLAFAGGLRRQGLGPTAILAELEDRLADGRIVSYDESDPWERRHLEQIAKDIGSKPTDDVARLEAIGQRMADSLGAWKSRVLLEPPVTPATKLRHSYAGDWILDAPERMESVWGAGQQSLWPKGEALMMVGGIGTGKTTIAQQLVLHGIGALEGPFLGYPVTLPPGVVGYIAADRPAQIRRSFRRMVDESMRDLVNDRMDAWSGALPFALDNAKTGQLADFVQERGWSALVIDSLKDVCSGTTDDESGLRINQQIQECTARGIEVLVLHHQRKASEQNRKPKNLDDVYGSRWLTAGAGSVVMLWGEAGSNEVEMSHLKQPAESVGPLTLVHDHEVGVTTAVGIADIKPRTKKVGRDAVLECLPATVAQIVAETGMARTTVAEHLSSLQADNLARKQPGHPGNKAPVYERVEQVSA